MRRARRSPVARAVGFIEHKEKSSRNRLGVTTAGTAGAVRMGPKPDPTYAELGFDESFGLLVDAEASYRENRRLKRVLREAKFRLGPDRNRHPVEFNGAGLHRRGVEAVVG